MQTRDRIKELRRVKASSLRPNPKNWRLHPQLQQDALRGVLAEIGYADALLARELPDGSLELIDGHLRAETTPDMAVPVLVVDLDAQEADKLLAVLDPLAALAATDDELFRQLREGVTTHNEALQRVLDDLAGEQGRIDDLATDDDEQDLDIPEAFQLVVECTDEDEQCTLFDRLVGEGYKCRVLNL